VLSFSWGHYLQEGIQPLAELAALIHKKLFAASVAMRGGTTANSG